MHANSKLSQARNIYVNNLVACNGYEVYNADSLGGFDAYRIYRKLFRKYNCITINATRSLKIAKALIYCVRSSNALTWLCLCACSSEPTVHAYAICTKTT